MHTGSWKLLLTYNTNYMWKLTYICTYQSYVPNNEWIVNRYTAKIFVYTFCTISSVHYIHTYIMEIKTHAHTHTHTHLKFDLDPSNGIVLNLVGACV